MKLLVITLAFFTFSHARQYIQCAHPQTWDRMVINLDGEESSLFLTNGVHLPDEMRVLKDLYQQSVGDDFHVYETRLGPVKDEVIIETQYIDRALSYFPVQFKMTHIERNYSQSFELSCFSSIYND